MAGWDRSETLPEHRSMREAAERYRSLFSNNPHGVFSLDLQGSYVDANPACERMSGYSADELRRLHFRDLITPEGHAAALVAFGQVLAGDPVELETCIRHRDGRLIDVNLVAMPVCVDDELVGVHGVVEDITERKRTAAALEEARRRAVAADAAKSLLLANMSHELRTPLTTMLATAEMFEETDLDPVQRRFVTTMQRAGGRLRRLIDDILDFSRIESRTMQLRTEPFRLVPVLQDVVAVVGPAAEAKGLALDVTLAPDLPPWFIGDPLRVSQVVTNLLDNAVKFTARGSVALSVSMVDRRPHSATVRLAVRDTGVGIAEELQEVLFDPFVQADPSATRRHEGAGLGLAICSQLVELMHGTIDLDSALGEGTLIAVTITLPVAPVPRQGGSARAAT